MSTAVTSALVEIENVSKWYGEVLGLNDVTATLRPGVTGLLGPNGAGKSTLIKVICGMLRPNLGRVRVNGKTPFNHPSVMRRVGLCPEQDAVYPGAAVWDVLTYLTRLHGFPKAQARDHARRALERVGLADHVHRPATGFSKGMRQRMKLAQALSHDPDIVILDEPLNGLDPPGRIEFAGLIRELGDEGCVVLVSSHVLHEVEGLSDRIVVLNHGRILADGTSRSIRDEMSEFPLTVRIHTTAATALAAQLVGLDGVRRVENIDAGLEVLTHQPTLLFDAVAQCAAEGTFPIDAVVPMDEDLEAIFRYLTQ